MPGPRLRAASWGTQSVTVRAATDSGSSANCNGNGESRSVSYIVDTAAPTVTGTRTQPANAAGWNKGERVDISWTASDPVDGTRWTES